MYARQEARVAATEIDPALRARDCIQPLQKPATVPKLSETPRPPKASDRALNQLEPIVLGSGDSLRPPLVWLSNIICQRPRFLLPLSGGFIRLTTVHFGDRVGDCLYHVMQVSSGADQ